MKKEWTTVEVLRHARHDWLNKLQLIKGNLSLNKIERVQEIITEIVIESQNEAKLSNLMLPHFSALILTHNWEENAFQLNFEVMDHQNQYKFMDDLLLTDWTKSFFTILNKIVKPLYENHLSITIEPQQSGLRFFFDFSGIIVEMEEINQFLKSTPVGIKVERSDISEREFTIEVFADCEL
jgi:stage 0 sporulation protein B (sporulation initiation phosphotransferase)